MYILIIYIYIRIHIVIIPYSHFPIQKLIHQLARNSRRALSVSTP